jgi:hypothetical protein
MNMTTDTGNPQDLDAWAQHNLSQLRYFRSLSLREKFQAVEGMADIWRQLEQMRTATGREPVGEPGPNIGDPATQR